MSRRQLRKWEAWTRPWVEERGDPELLLLFERNLRRERKSLRLYGTTRFCSFATGTLLFGYVGMILGHMLFGWPVLK